MELPMAAAIAVLYATGTYMILRPNLIRLAMGFGLYSNATNLLLITIGGYTRTSGAPFVGKDPQSAVGLMDPLPPDIILTAIVISFAVGALTLIICYRVYLDHGTDNPERLPTEDEHDTGDELPSLTVGSALAPVLGPGNHPSTHGVPSVAPTPRRPAERRGDR
jgi:multicomponent Na+:H+ antiporter subunit C